MLGWPHDPRPGRGAGRRRGQGSDPL